MQTATASMKISLDAAMRARDVSQPSEAHERVAGETADARIPNPGTPNSGPTSAAQATADVQRTGQRPNQQRGMSGKPATSRAREQSAPGLAADQDRSTGSAQLSRPDDTRRPDGTRQPDGTVPQDNAQQPATSRRERRTRVRRRTRLNQAEPDP